MKKPSKKQILRIKNINNKERKTRRSQCYYTSRLKRNVETIKFTENISLFIPRERDKIVKLIQAAESGSASKYYLDFSNVKILNPLTALYIKHYLDKYPDARFKSKNCKNVIPRAAFKLLGFNKSFCLRDIKNSKYHTYVDDWNICSGKNCDLSKPTLDHLIEMRAIFKDKGAFLKLSDAIMEAINNVVQHAYCESTYKKWFMLTHVSKDNKSISVVVSDLGASVPFTIPKSFTEKFKDILNYDVSDFLVEVGLIAEPKTNSAEDLRSFNDSKLIKIATRLNSTRTNQAHRGKGFNDILSLVKNAKDFEEIESVTTSVLSRSGSYVYKACPNGLSKEISYEDSLKDFTNQIKGTVISWTIQLV